MTVPGQAIPWASTHARGLKPRIGTRARASEQR